jgi:hypothetical protein
MGFSSNVNLATASITNLQLAQPAPALSMYSAYLNPYIVAAASGTGAAPAPAPGAAPGAPVSQGSTVSDLQVLIASIPIAQDGQVISAEYHNSVRAAFIAMANRLGLGIIAEEIHVTNAPRLTKVEGVAEWKHDLGHVKKATAEALALKGWMEMDLPDGARIKKMNVFAANGDAGTMKLRLRRQSVSSTTGDDLILINVTNNDAAVAKEGDVTLPDTTMGAAAIEESRIIDNTKYKYLFIADLENAVAAKDAKILSVQVVLGK